MKKQIQDFFLPHIVALTPYSSARDEYTGTEGIFLDANENPYSSANGKDLNRYPDPYQAAIKQKIAPIKGVQPSQIFLGNGSDEPIDLLIRATCQSGQDSILIMPPTYGMYQVSADINNVSVIKVPLTTDYQIDTKNVLANIQSNTKIVWVCSPNNPTGNLLKHEAIIEILENFDGLVVIDEAYIDFVIQPRRENYYSFVQLLKKYQNLVVLQTFSKAWGLASLRTGMAFANEGIIKILSKIKSPYNISGPAQQLLFEALDHEKEKNEMVETILTERARLVLELKNISTVEHVYPSDTNFLFVKMKNAAAAMRHLIEQKIIVRDRSNVKLCEGCCRITVGTEDENNALIEALQQL